MAVVEIPKLPSLMVVGQGKYRYVTTYKIGSSRNCLETE